jgi:iron complex transport system substrate-binding protein
MCHSRSVRFLLAATALPLLLALSACKDEGEKKAAVGASSQASFLNVGEFAVARKDGYIEARDGAGRTLALVPPGGKAPASFSPSMVVHIPAKRVMAYGAFEIGLMKAMGVVDQVVAVTDPPEKWVIPEIRQGFAEGRIAYVGDGSRIDYERVKAQRPDLVLTWDPSIVPMMDSMGIPVVVTTTPIAQCLNTRVRLVEFLAAFFGKEAEAQAYYRKVDLALQSIREKTKGQPKPKAMWGDIYEKRVAVEPGNAWVSELIGLAQSDYQFKDVYGRSCVEISSERFLYSGKDADIYFTYRTPNLGATSKARLAHTNPLIAGIRPLTPQGNVYAPLPIYSQSADKLDELLTEISALLHPGAYPDYQLKYFLKLPETDPAPVEEAKP